MYVADKLDDSIKYFIDHTQYTLNIALYNIVNDNGIITAVNNA